MDRFFYFVALCVCVCSCVRLEFFWDFCLLSPNAFLPKWLFHSVIFDGMKTVRQPRWLSPLQGFCFLSLKPESAGRGREKKTKNYCTRECSCGPWLRVLDHMLDDSSAAEKKGEVEKTSPSFLFMIFIKRVGLSRVLRGGKGWFSLSDTQQKGTSAMLSAAESVLKLNRFLFWVEMWSTGEPRLGIQEWKEDGPTLSDREGEIKGSYRANPDDGN